MVAQRWTKLAPLAVLVALGLAACGDGDAESSSASDTPSSSPSSSSAPASDHPACDEVWQEGADLPATYRGCMDGEEMVAPKIVGCESGQRIVTYDDHFWAVRGHVIGYAPDGLADDKAYADVLYSCRA